MSTQLHRSEAAAQVSAGKARKYLSFRLGAEHYGVEVLRVREIIGLAPITPLPGVPGFVRGVMNLRGRIMPVLDLRARLGLPRAEATQQTCIIVIEGEGLVAGAAPVTGVVVDAVEDVQDIAEESIEPAPDFGGASALRCVRGLARTKEAVLVLLDASRMTHVGRGEPGGGV